VKEIVVSIARTNFLKIHLYLLRVTSRELIN